LKGEKHLSPFSFTGSAMHIFDVIFGVITLILILLGLYRGFIDEVMRLVAVVAGFICGILFYRHFAPRLSFLSLSPHVACVVSFLVIFIACIVVIVLFGKILKKVVNITMLGWLDRLCGACIGAIKAFFFGWVFFIAVSALPFSSVTHFFRGSRAFSFFIAISPVLKTHMPNKTSGVVRQHGFFLLPGDIWSTFKPSFEKKDSLNRKGPTKSPAQVINGDAL
jgi:membrane protein required for colicin V production